VSVVGAFSTGDFSGVVCFAVVLRVGAFLVAAFVAGALVVEVFLAPDCLAAPAFLAGAAFLVDAAPVGVAAAAFFGMVALWVVLSSVATGVPLGG
jgi:hypothetical protein